MKEKWQYSFIKTVSTWLSAPGSIFVGVRPRRVVLLYVIGFFWTVLIGLISGSQSGVLWGFFLLGVGIGLFSWRLGTREQRRRDEDAFRLFNAAKSGEIAQFAVFLRPFYTTKRIKITV